MARPFSLEYAGNLPEPENPLVAITSAAKLDFSWTDGTDPVEDPTPSTNVATVLAYSIEKDKFTRKVAAATRSAEAYVLQLPLDWSGDNVHAWIAFVSANGKEVSDSVYIGEFLIL